MLTTWYRLYVTGSQAIAATQRWRALGEVDVRPIIQGRSAESGSQIGQSAAT